MKSEAVLRIFWMIMFLIGLALIAFGVLQSQFIPLLAGGLAIGLAGWRWWAARAVVGSHDTSQKKSAVAKADSADDPADQVPKLLDPDDAFDLG